MENYLLERIKRSAYPKTTPTELKSVYTFNSLVDPHYIKPHTDTNDKTPDIDGYVVITNAEQVKIGNIEVQIKTLQKRNINSPKYQCKNKFLKYCSESQLPVILVTVDQSNNKAYWLLIDESVISEALKRLKKESVSINIPIQNCIDGKNRDYIREWNSIVAKHKSIQTEYLLIAKRKEELEKEISHLREKVNVGVGKTNESYKEIHTFLDFYNGLLDREFNLTKQFMYPDYWKIGLGILRYNNFSVSYIFFPVKLIENDVLIKEFKTQDNSEIEAILTHQSALSFLLSISSNPIKSNYKLHAYKLVETDTYKALKNLQVFIDDELLAIEYLSSFVNTFCDLLGIENVSYFFIEDLLRGLNSNIHIVIEKSHSFIAPQATFNLDSLVKHTTSKYLQKFSSDAKRLLSEGYVHKVYEIHSVDYDLQLVYSYINYFRKKGVNQIEKPYKQIFKPRLLNNHIWEVDSKEQTLYNLKVFYANIVTVYNKFINTYLPFFTKEFKYFDVMLLVLNFATENKRKPLLDLFKLRSLNGGKREILVYDKDDPNTPICIESYAKRYREETPDLNKVEINGRVFRIISLQHTSMEFLFTKLPSFYFIKEKIEEKLKKWFQKKYKQLNAE